MFESVRKHQRLYLLVILLLIVPSFVFWGISGYEGFANDADEMASVAGGKIRRQEFDQAQRMQLENLRRMFGQSFDASLLDTPAARREVLEGLIAQRALLNESARNGIAVPDSALRTAIAGIPGLSKPDGSFDMERYRMLLQAQNMNEASFEQQMRRELSLQAIPDAISRTAMIPASVIDRVVALQGERRTVRELRFEPAQFAGSLKPDDAQLRKFYDEHAKRFEQPENADVEYLVLDAATLGANLVVDQSKVDTYYEQNKSRYTSPEERRASHILLTVPKDASAEAKKVAMDKAEALLKQLRGGADFAALAKANSQDPGSADKGGDLGFFTPDLMVKPFSDVAFALKEGQISDPVQTEFGIHLIKLTGIKPAVVKPLEQVRGEITQLLRTEEAGKAFAKDADAFSNMVYEQADSLKAVAERFKLKIETARNLTRQGLAGAQPNTPLANPKVLAALFSDDSIGKRRNTDAIEIAPNTLVAARITDFHPAARKPFDEVSKTVREMWMAEESHKAAVKAGEARLAEINSGKAESGFGSPVEVQRQGGANKLAPTALDAIFKAPVAKLPVRIGVDLGSAGYAIYELTSVAPPTADESAKLRAAFVPQMENAAGQIELSTYLDSLKNRSKVTRHPEVIQAPAKSAG